MRINQTSSSRGVSVPPPNATQMRLQGRWIVLARGTWITLVVLTLGIFFASLPVYVALLQTPCTGTACAWQQLTPEQVGVLKGMGLSLGDYAAYMVALTLASVVVCLVVSTLIVWRRSDDRMALLVALMLVTLGPIIVTTTVVDIPSPWQVPNEGLTFLSGTLVVLVFLLFPSGRFVPGWMRWLLVVGIALAGGGAILFLFHAPFSQRLYPLIFVGIVGTDAPGMFAQLYRYRYVSTPMQRQQTK